MRTLFDQYRKLLDRRALRYGVDGTLREAIHDADAAAHLDFGKLSFQSSTPNHPEDFFLPFDEVAAEVVLPEPYGRLMICLGNSSVIIPRKGEKAKFLQGRDHLNNEQSYGCMLVTTMDDAPSILRIIKFNFSWGTDAFGEADYGCTLYSVCTYDSRTGKCVSEWFAAPGKVYDEDGKAEKTVLAMATHILRLIEIANSPANWIVEIKDEHARIVHRQGKPTKIKRTRYIVVPDRDLDRIIRIPNEGSDHIERQSHRRRAHWRRLMSPKFRLRQGERVLVRESWVGPKSALVGNERYTVLTSLPSSGSITTGEENGN